MLSQRANNAADLLVAALGRDMRGVQESVLLSSQWSESTLASPHLMYRLVQSALARYPYPEAFFGWRGALDGGDVTFISRADRVPAWSAPSEAGPFPLHVTTNACVAAAIGKAFDSADPQQAVWVTSVDIDGVVYQLVAHPLYRDAYREQPVGGLGFLVNMAWARTGYFPELMRQVSKTDAYKGLVTRVVDDRGIELVRTGVPASTSTATRRLKPMFADPDIAGPGMNVIAWTVEVAGDARQAVAAANVLGYRGPLLLSVGLIAGLLALGLAMVSHSSRAAAQLAEMRSEFAATMTHELKTPVASVRALGEAIAAGRVSDAAAVREYGQLVVDESERLGRLVANALAFARTSEVSQLSVRTAIDVAALLDDALVRFRSQLSARKIPVELDVSETVPQVAGDAAALSLVLDNLIDNAIRYGGERPSLEISARTADDAVVISVRDRGIGIPADELPHIRRKFFRGRSSGPGGAGLGLTIVERTLASHNGLLTIENRTGGGTNVSIVLPRMEVTP